MKTLRCALLATLMLLAATLSAQAHTVTLHWVQSVSPGITGSNVYRGTVPGGPKSRLNSALITGTTSYVDTLVSPGVTYYYAATSVNTSGAESAYSTEVAAAIPAGLIASFTASPGTTSGGPTNLCWTTTAAGVSINQSVGPVTAPSGCTSVSPTSTLIYTLTATLGATTETASVTVNVTGSTVGDHYVSQAGLDSNDGLSPDRPWRSIGKVNGSSFAPGNKILFKAGDGWSGTTLTVPSSGTSGHQIVFGAYGSGAKPILTGASTGVSINGKDYITLSGLAIQNASTCISVRNSTGTQILNTDWRNCSVWGLRGGSSDVVAVGNPVGSMLVDHSTCAVDSGRSMQAWCMDIIAESPSTSVKLTNNTCNLTGAVSSAPACMETFGTSNTLMQYNHSHGGQQAYSIKPGGVTVTGGQIIDNDADGIVSGNGGDGETIELEGASGHQQTSVTVARNVITCNPASNGSLDAIGVFQAAAAKIYGNVLLNACNVPASVTSLARFIHLSSNSPGAFIYNNTLVGKRSVRPDQVGIEVGSGSGGTVENNIFSDLGTGIHANSGAVITHGYNLYDTTVTDPTRGSMTSLGHDLTSTNPLFATLPAISANNVKLQSGSPAIGAGATLGSPYSSILGMGGTSTPYPIFTQTAPYASGAFGFGAGVGGGPPGSPTISSFTASPTTIASGSPSTLSWDTTDATNLTIVCDGDSGTFAVTGDSGSITISPTSTETCTLTAQNDVGSTSQDVTITVAVPVAPVIESFTADPASIPSGHYSMLRWVVDGADSVILKPGNIDVTAFNMWLVQPRATQTYTLRATNSIGFSEATVTVEIFTPVGPAAENLRYHQMRQYDRRGTGNEFQMYGGWPPPQPNYPALYDQNGNVIPAQPRGTDSSVVQMADSTEDTVAGHVAVFDEKRRVKDSGMFPGETANGCGVWYQEVPVGVQDGVNTEFFLHYLPSSPFVILTVNGVVQNPYSVGARDAEFVLSGSEVIMTVAPKVDDSFVIWYFACTGIEAEIPPPPTPVSAVLNVTSAYPSGQDPSYTPLAFMTPSVPAALLPSHGTFWNTTAFSGTISGTPASLTEYTGQTVTFQLQETLGGPAAGPGVAQFAIYDINIVFTMSDGSTRTVRPVSYHLATGTDGGTAINPVFAMDDDPLTSGTLRTTNGGPLSTASVLTYTF